VGWLFKPYKLRCSEQDVQGIEMHNGVMKAWLESSHLAGANASYIEDLYESFLENPESVADEWRSLFEQLPQVNGHAVEQPHSQVRDYFRRLAKDPSRYSAPVSDPQVDAKQVRVLQMINAFRFRGHQNANLDPLGLWTRETVAELDPAFHNLQGADMEATFNVGSYAIGRETMVLSDLYASLKKTYCSSIGADYMHLTSTEEKRWLQDRLESIEAKGNYSTEEKSRFLESLTAIPCWISSCLAAPPACTWWRAWVRWSTVARPPRPIWTPPLPVSTVGKPTATGKTRPRSARICSAACRTTSRYSVKGMPWQKGWPS